MLPKFFFIIFVDVLTEHRKFYFHLWWIYLDLSPKYLHHTNQKNDFDCGTNMQHNFSASIVWDQWLKLEKSASHSGKKSTVNKSAQCEQTDIYLLYEINRCEHCYVTACIFIYTSFQITAKMLNANLMNRQQTSIMLQTKWNYVCMSYHAHSLYNSTHKKGKQSLRIISLSTQSCLFFCVFAIWCHVVFSEKFSSWANRILKLNNSRFYLSLI